MPPLEVRITGGHAPVTAGSSVRLVCQTSGSNPPANLSWWEGGQRLTDVTYAVSARRLNATYTVSARRLNVTYDVSAWRLIVWGTASVI